MSGVSARDQVLSRGGLLNFVDDLDEAELKPRPTQSSLRFFWSFWRPTDGNRRVPERGLRRRCHGAQWLGRSRITASGTNKHYDHDKLAWLAARLLVPPAPVGTSTISKLLGPSAPRCGTALSNATTRARGYPQDASTQSCQPLGPRAQAGKPALASAVGTPPKVQESIETVVQEVAQVWPPAWTDAKITTSRLTRHLKWTRRSSNT